MSPYDVMIYLGIGFCICGVLQEGETVPIVNLGVILAWPLAVLFALCVLVRALILDPFGDRS